MNEPTLFNLDDHDGFVNRPASKARAHNEARDGTRNSRHKKILKYLDLYGRAGATWKELGERLGLHHGQISGALSNMHKNGEVFTLVAQRDRCHPYVHAKFREGFAPEERFDEPAKTAGALRAEEIERLIAERDKWMEVAHQLYEALGLEMRHVNFPYHKSQQARLAFEEVASGNA